MPLVWRSFEYSPLQSFYSLLLLVVLVLAPSISPSALTPTVCVSVSVGFLAISVVASVDAEVVVLTGLAKTGFSEVALTLVFLTCYASAVCSDDRVYSSPVK